MWIFTTRGFFSVVQDDKDPNYLHVRARKKADLENLRKEFGLSELVLELPEADYRWRLIVPRSVWARIGHRLIDEINYPKFKPAVHAQKGQEDKEVALLDVWRAMYLYQQEQPGAGVPELPPGTEWVAPYFRKKRS